MIETKLLIRYADSLWSKLICNEFKGRCMICGRIGSDAHHWAFGRSIRKYRWHLMNGVWLCRQDHEYSEMEAAMFMVALGMNCRERMAWRDSLPTLVVEPFPNYKIQKNYDFLKEKALSVGICKGEQKNEL